MNQQHMKAAVKKTKLTRIDTKTFQSDNHNSETSKGPLEENA